MPDPMSDAIHEFADRQDMIPDEKKAELAGHTMRLFDCLAAIANGESWQGLSDPQEMVIKLLADMSNFGKGMGDV